MRRKMVPKTGQQRARRPQRVRRLRRQKETKREDLSPDAREERQCGVSSGESHSEQVLLNTRRGAPSIIPNVAVFSVRKMGPYSKWAMFFSGIYICCHVLCASYVCCSEGSS